MKMEAEKVEKDLEGVVVEEKGYKQS